MDTNDRELARTWATQWRRLESRQEQDGLDIEMAVSRWILAKLAEEDASPKPAPSAADDVALRDAINHQETAYWRHHSQRDWAKRVDEVLQLLVKRALGGA